MNTRESGSANTSTGFASPRTENAHAGRIRAPRSVLNDADARRAPVIARRGLVGAGPFDDCDCHTPSACLALITRHPRNRVGACGSGARSVKPPWRNASFASPVPNPSTGASTEPSISNTGRDDDTGNRPQRWSACTAARRVSGRALFWAAADAPQPVSASNTTSVDRFRKPHFPLLMGAVYSGLRRLSGGCCCHESGTSGLRSKHHSGIHAALLLPRARRVSRAAARDPGCRPTGADAQDLLARGGDDGWRLGNRRSTTVVCAQARTAGTEYGLHLKIRDMSPIVFPWLTSPEQP